MLRHLLIRNTSNEIIYFVNIKNKVIFVWSVRDKATSDAISHDKLISHLPRSFQPEMGLTDRRIFTGNSASKVSTDFEMQNPISQTKTLDRIDEEFNSKFVFHSEYYLTQPQKPEETTRADVSSENFLFYGQRPNINAIFKRTEKLCLNESIKRVVVGVCGPEAMINEVADSCKSFSSKDVNFICHKETFDF